LIGIDDIPDETDDEFDDDGIDWKPSKPIEDLQLTRRKKMMMMC